MIKIGDKVKFLNAVGGGVVKSFSGKNIANIEDEEGFEVPTLISQLVLVDAGKENETEKRKPETTGKSITRDTVKKETIVIEPVNEAAFYLAFVPENSLNPVGGDMKAYLVNGSSYSLLFNYSYVQSGEYATQRSGKVESGTKLLIDRFSSTELNSLPDFFFQLLYFSYKSKKVEMPIFKLLKINPVKLYKEKSFCANSFFSEKAYLIKIQNSDFEDQLKGITSKEIQKAIREKQEPKKKEQAVLKSDLVEIDLHIHELLDDTRGLSNREMLEIQMDTFRERLNEAIKFGTKKIVFIHGVGNGTLKTELRKELSRKFKKYAFQDASFQEYGFGATMVILKK